MLLSWLFSWLFSWLEKRRKEREVLQELRENLLNIAKCAPKASEYFAGRYEEFFETLLDIDTQRIYDWIWMYITIHPQDEDSRGTFQCQFSFSHEEQFIRGYLHIDDGDIYRGEVKFLRLESKAFEANNQRRSLKKIRNWRLHVQEELEAYLNQYARRLEERFRTRMQRCLISRLDWLHVCRKAAVWYGAQQWCPLPSICVR